MSAFSPGCPRVFQTWLEFHELWGKKQSSSLHAKHRQYTYPPSVVAGACVASLASQMVVVLKLFTNFSHWSPSARLREQKVAWHRQRRWNLAFPPLRMTAVIAGYADTNAVSLEMFFRFKFIFKLCHFKLGGSFHVMSTPMLFQVRWFFSSYVDANVISSCVVSVLLLCWLCVMSTQMLFQVVRCGEFHAMSTPMLFSKLCGYTCYFKLCGYTYDFKLCRPKIVYPVVSIQMLFQVLSRQMLFQVAPIQMSFRTCWRKYQLLIHAMWMHMLISY